jgi:hypothetical protein
MLYFYFTGSRIFSLKYRKNSGTTLLLRGCVTPESASALIRGPCFIVFSGKTAASFTHATKHLTGVFAPLNGPQFFSRVFIESGALAWPNNINLAPDAVYQKIKKQGECLLD